MSERTPKTNTIRAAWAHGHPFPLTTNVDERYAEFDRWLAAHDAEVRASVVAEEPEWAVSVARTTGYGDPVIYDFPDRLAAERFIKNPPLWFSREDHQTKTLVRRRKAGPWVPVKQE